MKSQEQMLQATNAAAEAMKDLTDAGARKEQIQALSNWFSRLKLPQPSPKRPTTACRTSSTRA